MPQETRRHKIAFYAGSSIPIHARSLEERPLGGTETGVIRLAEALQAKGHEVTVFTSHKAPPPSTPRYLPESMVLSGEPFDVIVLVQDWRPAFFPLPAPRVWFLTGDGPEIYSTFGLGDKRIFSRIERFLAVSNYHREALCKASGFPIEKAVLLGNGVYLPHFEGEEARDPHRLIYSSAPYRGLVHVPWIFSEVRKAVPDASLHVFSGMDLYRREGRYEGPHAGLMEKLTAQLVKVPGVVIHSTVTQNLLAREYMKSALYVYPATVPETCCITALEARAAGCALVTSDIGALRETVGRGGIIVPGAVDSAEFKKGMVETIVDLLSSPVRRGRYGAEGKADIVEGGTWTKVAERFEGLLGLEPPKK